MKSANDNKSLDQIHEELRQELMPAPKLVKPKPNRDKTSSELGNSKSGQGKSFQYQDQSDPCAGGKRG